MDLLQTIKAGRNKFLKLRSILNWLLMFSKIPLLLDEKPKNQPFFRSKLCVLLPDKGGGVGRDTDGCGVGGEALLMPLVAPRGFVNRE